MTVLAPQFRETVELSLELGDVPKVECFPGKVNQVFMNVLTNAAQAPMARADGRPRKVTVATREVDEFVEVRITDSGVGMTDDVKARIFDPFFTTKPVGEGTGLGLAIVYGIINEHAGHITVEDHAIISGLAAAHQFCQIGMHSITGGLSKVTQDVPPFMLVDGNPASTRGINVVGLQRRGFSEDDIRAIKTAYKKLFLKKEGNLETAISSLKATHAGDHPQVRHLIDFIERSKRGVTR